MSATPESEIERFLRSGEYDPTFAAWPEGGTIIERLSKGDAAIRAALSEEVRKRASGRKLPSLPADIDPIAFTRSRVAPMVAGLFPERERGVVLDVLAGSVVFVTAENILSLITADDGWPHTAWTLANLYLGSIGAEPFSTDEHLVGFSEETTCYVTGRYFEETDRFADFIVHEAAHIFHNCKRESLGLSATRTRERLLPVEYRKRETFAYACEAFSRILSLGTTRSARLALHTEMAGGPMPSDERVDAAEYVDILREAVAARNGWKRILRRCSSVSPSRRVVDFVRVADDNLTYRLAVTTDEPTPQVHD